jgi:hypothetical protein
MTGCLGPGKPLIAMIAMALEDFLTKYYGNHVHQLNGNNFLHGLQLLELTIQ